MDGVRSAVAGSVDNANRTVQNAGTAAAVASNEMPRLNNNLNAGINVMDHQAGELNHNLDTGINLMNEQASNMNQTAANGIDMMNHQAGELNETADAAVGEIGRAVTSFENSSQVVSDAIELWAPSIKMFVDILGPMQAFAAAHYFVLILKNLGLVRNVPQSIQQLNVTNAILQDMMGAYREVESMGIVQNITESSIVYDKSTNTLKAYFFYTQNNIVVEQLKGSPQNYFAYDSISELLKGVYCWNAFAEAAAQTKLEDPDQNAERKLKQFGRRQTIIYLLDPCPKPTVLSHLEFTKTHQNVTIKNHFQAKEHLTIESIKIREDCFVQCEHLTVCKVDATLGGKAHLHKCNVGWNQDSIPFLFGGMPDLFQNPHNVCGTVSCNECTTIEPSKNKKNKRKSRKSPNKNFMPCPSSHNGIKFDSFFRGTTTAGIKPCVAEGSAVARETLEQELALPAEVSQFNRTITNISDKSWHVRFDDNNGPYPARLIAPLGGQTSFFVPSAKPTGPVAIIFTDSNGEEYSRTFLSNPPNFTIVCPTIDGGRGGVAEVREGQASPHAVDEVDAVEEVENKPNLSSEEVEDDTKTILVVGRFGSGKSTFLNTLAGVHWTYIDDTFELNQGTVESKVETFKTSRSAKGCTLAAVAGKVTTFDGREVNLIDTIGYDDSVNSDIVYNDASLTEVISQHKTISAVAIVVNSRDPRLTQGFLESVLCIPKSFKKRIKENAVLVFTNWNEDDEDEHGDEPNRGFTEQIKIIRAALGFNEDDGPIPAFWMDNRPFKKCTSNARRTIDSLTSFLDAVDAMPELSCQDFKEMRALSQFERAVRKAIHEYFKPSNSGGENPSGFERFLFECASRREKNIKKVSWKGGFTAQDWSKELADALEEEINDGIPKQIEEICVQADFGLAKDLPYRCFKFRKEESMGGKLMKGLISSGTGVIIGTASMSLGISLAALPAVPVLAYAYSKTWSREETKANLVSTISKIHAEDIRQSCADAFTSHVDAEAQRLQNIFAKACPRGD